MKPTVFYYSFLAACVAAGLTFATLGQPMGLVLAFVFGFCFSLGWNLRLIAKAKATGQKLDVKRWAIQYAAWSLLALTLTICLH